MQPSDVQKLPIFKESVCRKSLWCINQRNATSHAHGTGLKRTSSVIITNKNHPRVCLTVRASVRAPQVRDVHLRGLRQRQGRAALSGPALEPPHSEITRNFLLRGRIREDASSLPTDDGLWQTKMKRSWQKKEKGAWRWKQRREALLWSLSPLQVVLHPLIRLNPVSPEPLKRTPRCSALFDCTWPILAFINHHFSSSFPSTALQKRAPQFFQRLIRLYYMNL